ncbi:MAG TPA: sulfotransferase [Rhodanobacteraceae bacterium]|nr:sulfotransferase [Rhodanobacteraceae bacterium]
MQRGPRPSRSPVADRLWARACKEWEQRQFDAAEQSLRNVLALAPDDMDATRMLGVAAQRRGDHAKAIDCFRRVLAVSPDDPALRVGLGIALYENGDVDESLAHLRRACELAPASSSAWFNLGKALEKEAHTEEAVAAFQRALKLDRSHISTRLSLARAQASLGQVETAVAGFREILHRDPGNAEAWFGLSNLNTVRFDSADTARLRRAFASEKLQDHDRELLGYAFAKALEDQNDYAQAFDVFGLVKASQAARVKGDAAGERDRVEAIRRTFATTTPLDAQLGHEAILIVSLPRSGSTLVEQILASHPEVEGANEINDLRDVIGAEAQRRRSPFPSWVPDATAEDWHRLGIEYLARTARWRKTKPRFTDKNLLNWYLVGAALTMLPAARVVVVRRDPLETCLACYRQYFTGIAGFACDLDDMADYCANFLGLTRFWLNKFPTRVFDLQYEALLADPDAVIHRLLDFCGLPFDPACLAFHETSRPVLSAPSAAQVRQPLRYDTARSALYGDKLDGLRRRLRELGALVD